MAAADSAAPLEQSGPTVEQIVRAAVEPPDTSGASADPALLGDPALTPGTELRSSRPYGAVWRLAVEEQLAWLNSLLDPRTASRAVLAAIVSADQAMMANRHRPRRQRVMAWWSGWDAERAWRSVHAAEVDLVAASPDLVARLPGIEQRVTKELPVDDRRRRELEAVRKRVRDRADKLVTDDDRVAVHEAMRAAFTAADDALTGVRNLRNRMVLFGALLGVVNLLLGIVAAVSPGWLTLCSASACPSGSGTAASGGDVVTVQLFGALGALLAVVMLLVHTKPGLLTYQLPGYLSFIKITLGATVAVVGVLGLLAAEFEAVIGSQAALLVAALVFGYSQQIATRFLDSYAERLVGKAKTGADLSREGRT
jgi:hypothetical protein